MVVLANSPKYWRNRAERARVVADAMQDKQAKQLMLCVAKDYERVAELAERRLQRGTRQREKPRWRRTGAFALLLAAALQEHMFDCSTALVEFGFYRRLHLAHELVALVRGDNNYSERLPRRAPYRSWTWLSRQSAKALARRMDMSPLGLFMPFSQSRSLGLSVISSSTSRSTT